MSQSGMAHVRCKCGTRLAVPKPAEGHKARCPNCGAVFRVRGKQKKPPTAAAETPTPADQFPAVAVRAAAEETEATERPTAVIPTGLAPPPPAPQVPSQDLDQDLGFELGTEEEDNTVFDQPPPTQ